MRTIAAHVLPHLFAGERLTVARIAAELGVTATSVREVGDDLEHVGMATLDGDEGDPLARAIVPAVTGDCAAFDAMARARGVDLDRVLAVPDRRRADRDDDLV